jgi:hypothetical protein
LPNPSPSRAPPTCVTSREAVWCPFPSSEMKLLEPGFLPYLSF